MQDNTQHLSMNSVDGKKITIVGAGPSGLTVARLLQQSSAQVVVHERDHSRSARVQGSALDLHEESGLAALEAAGLMEGFWANHRPDLDRLRLPDARGTVLHDHARRMSGAGKRPEIERGPLRDLLLDSSTKGALETLVKNRAAILGAQGIRVNAVAPGVIDTDMSNFTKTEAGREIALRMQALKRIGKPEDVADVVAFLASDGARWITGAHSTVA